MSDETKIIKLNRRNRTIYACFVDASDYEWLISFGRWSISTPFFGQWYATNGSRAAREVCNVRGQVYMHRLLLNAGRGQFVDHANGNGLDNRRSNIRIASWSDNMINKKYANTTTGMRGIKQRAKHKFNAFIRKNNVTRWLGTFPTAIEAARAYDRAAIELHGEFAVLNFPNEYAKAG